MSKRFAFQRAGDPKPEKFQAKPPTTLKSEAFQISCRTAPEVGRYPPSRLIVDVVDAQGRMLSSRPTDLDFPEIQRISLLARNAEDMIYRIDRLLSDEDC